MAEVAPERPLPRRVSGLPEGPFTYRDLFRIDDDRHRYEVVGGALVVSPFPLYRHQHVRNQILRLFWAAAPGDEAVNTDVTVRLHSDEHGLVPDVVVVAPDVETEGLDYLEASQVLAVVEVVSPGSATQDRTIKPMLYAEHGIPCFWRVELDRFRGRRPGEELPVVLVHDLDEESGSYRVTQRLSAGSTGRATAPFPVEFDPAELLPRKKK